ncbi:DAK2 domain-containing protein [Corynebacterium sp. 153RC1]|uniref:DAK2 domain-containing protein n=1 Tax=unclassified Corynebacterium TaxID=2624378 RepID=UPI00211CC156|nr:MULTISPECIES: DAK2 domain-containing protein [unclassified Corynebacterium]MCQ9370571.1 DAK2 domain-containing protein [Corynebacterium sp. 35RC1]MCQ9352913.1 DAK2 domain-containing protein [Corynebacterium sp. 209RC1]MCQ9353867.1 DAK2 domain-containing protein [Corynebacterium sp. 1222RC1]MCQ9356898.1 DAK2 domain-containing protein [Corynebacterium sp. 122RC1]MCQ9358251.1 DAK2 domain-containing protein [Corynebacterium sp. 142RC1]
MTTPPSHALDGHGLYQWAHAAADALEAHRRQINALNVFPVPDSDTGSNMAFTMRAAVDQAAYFAQADGDSAGRAQWDVLEIAAALAKGAVKGARGNSGVVLSQVLRGVAQACERGPLDAPGFQEALRQGLRFVEGAIAAPVEGTIITVLREVAQVGERTDAHPFADLPTLLHSATSVALTALKETPSQLPELREAGVVDAGGAGLVLVLDVLSQQLGNPAIDLSEVFGQAKSAPSPETPTRHSTQPALACSHGEGSLDSDSDSGSGYLEVMFYAAEVDRTQLAEALEPLGDSLVIAPASDSECTVHIHTERAAEVITAAYALATVSDLRIEVLPTAAQRHGEAGAPGRVVVVLSPAGELADLFAQAGALVVEAEAGKGRDRDRQDVVRQELVGEIAATIQHSQAKEVLLLPNGLLTKLELAAVVRASRGFQQNINIVLSGAVVRGLAALAVHDPTLPLAVDSYDMSEAVAGMRICEFTRAEKARLTPAGACAKHDVLATSGTNVLGVFDDLPTAIRETTKNMFAQGGERLTVLIHATAAQQERDAGTRAMLNGDALQHALEQDLAKYGAEVAVYPAHNMANLAEIGVE